MYIPWFEWKDFAQIVMALFGLDWIQKVGEDAVRIISRVLRKVKKSN